MKYFIRVMKALSEPNRVRILKLLWSRELCVCELQELLGLAQSTVSKHMRLLEDAGLITGRRDGAWVIYAINEAPAIEYAETMLGILEHWLDDDALLREMNKRLPFINRLQISAGVKASQIEEE